MGRIVVGVDGSESSKRALDFALRDVGADMETRKGDVPDVLRAAASDAELLIVGIRHRRDPTRMLLTSVSREVSRDAPCPLVIVPDSDSSERALIGAESEGEATGEPQRCGPWPRGNGPCSEPRISPRSRGSNLNMDPLLVVVPSDPLMEIP